MRKPLHLAIAAIAVATFNLFGAMRGVSFEWTKAVAPFAPMLVPAGGQTLIVPAATSEPFLFYRAVTVP